MDGSLEDESMENEEDVGEEKITEIGRDIEEDEITGRGDINNIESEKIKEKEKSDIAAAYLDLLSTFV